jgi:hypothetical protein
MHHPAGTRSYDLKHLGDLPKVPFVSARGPQWDYDFGCLLAYDASVDGVLAQAWKSVQNKKAFRQPIAPRLACAFAANRGSSAKQDDFHLQIVRRCCFLVTSRNRFLCSNSVAAMR